MIPTIPNRNAPFAQATTKDGLVNSIITPSWFFALAELFAAATSTGMIMIFAGATAPQGWVEDTTPGLPVLPGSMIWIRKL